VKAYNERINQVADELKAKGINLVGINSNATESLDCVASAAKEVGYKFPVLIDKGNVLADKLEQEEAVLHRHTSPSFPPVLQLHSRVENRVRHL
jgi:hypothetical protein